MIEIILISLIQINNEMDSAHFVHVSTMKHSRFQNITNVRLI